MKKPRRAKRKSATDQRPRRSPRLQHEDLPQLRQARALWAKNQLPQALRLFVETVRRHPTHELALIDASRALGNVYQFQRAEQLLAKLLELGGDRPQTLLQAGQSYRLMRRYDCAIDCFERCATARADTPDAHLELALLYERRNQLDDAWNQISKRLRLLPNDDEGLMVRGRLLRRKGELPEAEAELRQVVRRSSAHWLTRTRAHAELARVHEDQADDLAAWNAMRAGKKAADVHASAARAHRNRTLDPLYRLAEETSAEHLRAWKGDSTNFEQSVALLTGLPRSGTTLLQQILAAHTGVVCADEWDAFPRLIFPLMTGLVPVREINVRRLDQLPATHLNRKRHMYFRCLKSALAQPLEGKLLIDKNPSLLPLLPIYQRLLPDAKLIVLLRDPRDVLVSCLMTFFPLNDFSVDFLSLESAVSRLEADLQTWLQFRDKAVSPWVEIRYEQLVEDFAATLQQSLPKIGLDWQDELMNYRGAKGSTTVHSPSYEQVQMPIYQQAIGRWQRYARWLKPVQARLDRLADLLGYEPS